MIEERYSRQILFNEIGETGQRLLAKKHVLIVGVGTLGTKSAETLVRAGIGKLTIVDRDYVDWSNLQRQQLYTEKDVEAHLPKVVAAKRRLNEINSNVNITAHVMDLTPSALARLVKDIDLIIDGTDNFDTRMIINDISQKYRIPWIYGSCVGSYGVSFTILPGETPCLHCLIERIPIGGPTCDTVGIIDPTASQVVAYQTVEALKWLTDSRDVMRREFLSFDLWTNEQIKMDVAEMKKVDCPSCGLHATYPFLAYEAQSKTAILCGRDAVQIRPSYVEARDLEKLAKRLEKTDGIVTYNEFLLNYMVEGKRMVLFVDGRAIIHGTNNISEAKTLYDCYFS